MDEIFGNAGTTENTVSFDAQSLEAAEREMKEALAPVPPGEYTAYIQKFTYVDKPEKQYKGFNWQFKIVSDNPATNGKVVFHNTPIQRLNSQTGRVETGDDVTRWLRYLILAAVGTLQVSPDAYQDGKIQVTDEVFLNRMVTLTVVHNPNPLDETKPFVNVKFIKPHTEHGKRYDGAPISGGAGNSGFPF